MGQSAVDTPYLKHYCQSVSSVRRFGIYAKFHIRSDVKTDAKLKVAHINHECGTQRMRPTSELSSSVSFDARRVFSSDSEAGREMLSRGDITFSQKCLDGKPPFGNSSVTP